MSLQPRAGIAGIHGPPPPAARIVLLAGAARISATYGASAVNPSAAGAKESPPLLYTSAHDAPHSVACRKFARRLSANVIARRPSRCGRTASVPDLTSARWAAFRGGLALSYSPAHALCLRTTTRSACREIGSSGLSTSADGRADRSHSIQGWSRAVPTRMKASTTFGGGVGHSITSIRAALSAIASAPGIEVAGRPSAMAHHCRHVVRSAESPGSMGVTCW